METGHQAAPRAQHEDGAERPASTTASDERAGLITLIREDWTVHGRDWSSAGFRALLVYRLDSARMQSRPAIRLSTGPVLRFFRHYVRNHYGIELAQGVTIGRRLHIAHQGAIVVHPNARIGDDCIIRQGCTLGAVEFRNIDEAPTLGNGVRLGAGVVIIGRVRVGDNARIGPNAVVTKNVAANSAVMAPSAREFKEAVTDQ